MNVYYGLAFVTLVYLAILFLVNRIPHITVKSLGFFCLKRLTIELPHKLVKIKSLHLKINVWKRRDDRAKRVQLIIRGVTVLDKEQAGPIDLSNVDMKKPKRPTKDVNLKQSVSFNVPQRLYSLMYRYKLLNQCTILITNFSAYLDDTSTLSVHYGALDNTFNKDGHNSLVFTLFNGFLVDGTEQVQLFRNIEVVLGFDAITSVKDRTQVNFSLSNFELSLALGKVHVPLTHIKRLVSQRRKQTANASLVEEDEEKFQHDDDNSTEPLNPLSTLTKEQIDSLKDAWSLFDKVGLTLEDFTVSKETYSIHVANFQTAFGHSESAEHTDTDMALLYLHVSAFEILDGATECFKVATASLSVDCHPFGILIGLQNLFNEQVVANSKYRLDFILKFTVTNPTINLYYDQLVAYEERSKKAAKKTSSSNYHLNYLNLLMAFQYVSTKIVIVDTKLSLHLPPLGQTEYHRDAPQNSIVNHTIEALAQRFACKDIATLVCNKQPQRKKLHTLFKLKTYKVEVLENLVHLSKCNLLVSYCLDDEKFAVRFNAKNMLLKSINSAIFRLAREMQMKRIHRYNQRYAELSGKQKPKAPPTEESPANKVFVQLFEILPPIIDNVSFDLHNIQADIICKDGLPLFKFFDEELNEEVDLADYRRGVSLKISAVTLKYNRPDEELAINVSNIYSFTMSEYSSDYVADFDVVTLYKDESEFSDISSLGSVELAESEDYSLNKVKKVLEIESIEVSNSNNKQRDKNKLSIKIPVVDGRIDIFLAWCSVYASSLVESYAPSVQRKCTKEEMRSLTGKQETVLKLDLFINSCSIVFRLPNHVDVMMELDTLALRDIFETFSADLKYFRTYVIHPKTKLWARCLCLKNTHVILKPKDEIDSFVINSRGIRLNIPFGFEFYRVVDNLVTFGKAVRQVTHNFSNLCKNDNDFTRLLPQARDAFPVPKINIKTETFGLTIENDPFETELSYIFELGSIEQKERIRKWKIFEEKAEIVRNETIESKIELTVDNDPKKKKNAPKILSPLRNVLSHADSRAREQISSNIDSVTGSKPPMSEEDATAKIGQARDILEQELGTSWIQKFKRFKSVKIDNWQSRSERVWGDESINDIIVEKFDILNYSSGPLLMGAVFLDLDFGVSNATVDNIDQFLHEYGKGQPKLDYSILIPAHISIKSKGVFIFLKDYTLPLLSFPKNTDANKTAFHLSGNIVINEKIVYRKEEMRFIKVPFSPPQAENFDNDSFYHTFIARTLTPIKFMMNLKCHIDCDRAAVLTWCESYTSALLTSMTAVDKFTKPQIDDSPLGWWDKMALLCHGRMQFDIPNELCFHMKSSGNPYDLIGRASGFVFSWKNNVTLTIHDNDNPKELLKLESDDFLLAIPNYCLAERKTWSLFYDELSDDAIDFDSEAKKYQKKVMKFSSDERVKWKLGLLFETNVENTTTLSDENERTSDFIPHYDVIVTNPAFEWHPDSYEGFRSDYLHLAISVESTSKKGNASNTVHLTPLTFTYFFFWWDTLTDLVSLPVRQGTLYDNREVDKSHVNMSPHLFTVKYQLILEPLTISHMYIHATGDKNSKVAFTGLKLKSSKCVIDLHQRKEMLTYVNEELNIKSHTMKLKMNLAEIVFDSPDIRLVNAVFPDKSFKVKVAKYLAGSILSPSDSSSGEDFGSSQSDWEDNIHVFDGDYSWIDNEDFIELETREVLSPYPKITVYPFAYSPRITYIREFSLNEEGPHPFGAEDSHDCQLGLEKPEDTQAKLLRRRLTAINEEIEASEELLKTIGNPADGSSGSDANFIKLQIESSKEKREVIESIYETITGNYLSDDASEAQNSSTDVSRLNTRQLSVYSSHRSFADLKEAKLLNKTAANFHNRFIVHNLQLKWNNNVRDMFLDYIQHVSDRRSEAYFMSKKAVDLVESMINSIPESDVGADPGASNDDKFEQGHEIREDVMNTFYEHLQRYNSETEEPENKYLIKLIHPQIQLVSQMDPNSALLVVSRDLEMRIIAINVKGIKNLINESTHIAGLIETRYGGLFDDSSMYVFKREDTIIIDQDVPYGYLGDQLAINWPPWVEAECIYDDSWSKRQLIAHRNSMALSYSKPNFLYVESNKISQLIEIKQHLPKIVLTMDSKQYSTFFYIATDLLMKSRTTRDELMNRIEKVMALSDTEDFFGLDTKVSELQNNIRLYHDILLKLDLKSMKLTPTESQGAMHVEVELEKMKLELGMIMRGLRLRNSKSKATRRMENMWRISAEQIIWHFIDSDGAPLIDLALANTHFTRLDGVDGSNKNQLDVSMVQGFNLQEKAIYPELLQPILEEGKNKSEKPVIRMSWQMLNPVGGIPIVQYARLSIQPLKIQLDYHTSTLLFDYLFPKSDKTTKQTAMELDHSGKQSSDASSIVSTLNSSKKGEFTPAGSIVSSHRGSEIPSVKEYSFDESSNSKLPCSANGRKLHRRKTQTAAEQADDISIIVARSSKFMSIMDMKIEDVKLVISFKAPPHLNIIDVHNLSLNVPTLKYTNKIWCSEDIIYRLRKDVIKVILQHSGKILSNKFKVRRRSILSAPLKQISNYVSYVSVLELQGDAQTESNSELNRGNRLVHHHPHHHHHHHHLEQSSPQESPSVSQTLDNMLQEIADEEDDEETQDTNNK